MSTIRLVVIDTKNLKYSIYEGRKEIAVWQLDNDTTPLTAEEVESIRTQEYKEA